ncbi:MAG: hypothetical protein U0559_17615 [Anaerolineae bacterium]
MALAHGALSHFFFCSSLPATMMGMARLLIMIVVLMPVHPHARQFLAHQRASSTNDAPPPP